MRVLHSRDLIKPACVMKGLWVLLGCVVFSRWKYPPLYLLWIRWQSLSIHASTGNLLFFLLQVTQPLGYVGTLPAIRINESTAEWTTRDCYVSLLAALPPFSSIKLLRNCPIFLNNFSKTKFTNIIILYYYISKFRIYYYSNI